MCCCYQYSQHRLSQYLLVFLIGLLNHSSGSTDYQIFSKSLKRILLSNSLMVDVYNYKVNSYAAQVEYQNMAIQELTLTHLFYKGYLNRLTRNMSYVDARYNSMLNDSSLQDNYIYESSWYNPNHTVLENVPDNYFIDVLGYNSFFSRALMNNNYTLLEKEFLMSISKQYGTTVFYPYYNTPEVPDKDIRTQYDQSFDNCSYNNTPRKYYYEYRCDYEFYNAEKVNNTDVVYNWPYLYYENDKQKIINSVCSRIVDYSQSGDPFKGSNCLEYNTELLRQKLNSSSYNQDGMVRTYIIAGGSRFPSLYDRNLTLLRHIEDLEYDENSLMTEKQDYIDKTYFFQTVYPQQSVCGGFGALKQKVSSEITRDQLQYYLISRNLSICINPDQSLSNNTSYEEQIVGTIVTEVSLLQEQVRVQQLTDNISLTIQLTGICSVMFLISMICLLNSQAMTLSEQLSEPLDDMIYRLRTLDESSMQTYFIEMLQGELKGSTPEDLAQLIRAIQDFVGIVRIANEAFNQGNDSQATIGYAVACQFYVENGNILGSGVILNNMGAIHMRNKRYSESINSFREAIDIIENEWDRYKKKYMKYGVAEQELQVDTEFQKLSTIVLNRCFNLCECLSQYLLTETILLEEYLFQHADREQIHATLLRDSDKRRLRNASSLSMEKMIYAQMSLNRFDMRSKENSLAANPNEKIPFLDEIEPEETKSFVNPDVIEIVKELCGINETLARFRLRLIQRNQPDIKLKRQSLEKDSSVQITEVIELIKSLWKDTILTYRYCKYLMENHLQYTERDQKKLYIYLKIILGHLYLGQITECDDLINDAEDILNELQYKAKNNQYHDEDFQYPISILEQKYYLYKGIIFYKMGLYRKATEFTTKSLKCQGQYSPRDRVEALLILRTIFQSQNLDYSSIEEFLRSYQIVVKDIIFCLDFGNTMCRNRNIIKAIHVMNKIFELVNGQNDRIGYYLFSNEVREVVPLTNKVRNDVYLHEVLQLVPQPVKYDSNYEGAIQAAIKQMLSNHHPNLLQHNNQLFLHNDDDTMTPHKRSIIVLSDQFQFEFQGDALKPKFNPILEQKLIESKSQLLLVTFGEEDISRDFDNSNPNIQVFEQKRSQKLLDYFEELEEKIELPGTNFYLEKII